MSRNKAYAKAIIAVNRILTTAIYIFYPAMIVYLAVSTPVYRWIEILPYVAVPGISFIMVSIFRSRFNAPRPYEMPGAPVPIIKKDSPGKSFPSRHIFSIFIIAVTAFVLWPPVGMAIALAGVLLADCRVLGGVHFPRDVVAGAITGIVLGAAGYWVIVPMLMGRPF